VARKGVVVWGERTDQASACPNGCQAVESACLFLHV